jgi:beta-N-acetylglucosaminidase
VNDRIDAADARRRADLTGRAPLVWDNTPVNDGLMREALHLGPLGGRDPVLREACSGILWNPMEFATASIATWTSAAAWLRGDDHVAAWRAEVHDRGWYHLALATAFRGEEHWPGDEPDATWWAEIAAGLPATAADVGLDDGVQPWIDAAREGAAIALDALAVLERIGTRGTGTGTTMRQFGLAARWRAWRRRDVLTFGGGPRVRPVLGQDDRGEFVGRASAFELDESLVDALVRRALHS